MSTYKVIKGAVSTKDGMVNLGGTMESSPEDARHLIDNGFVELVLAMPVSAPSVEVVVEDAPVEKPVAVAPQAAVKGQWNKGKR